MRRSWPKSVLDWVSPILTGSLAWPSTRRGSTQDGGKALRRSWTTWLLLGAGAAKVVAAANDSKIIEDFIVLVRNYLTVTMTWNRKDDLTRSGPPFKACVCGIIITREQMISNHTRPILNKSHWFTGSELWNKHLVSSGTSRSCCGESSPIAAFSWVDHGSARPFLYRPSLP